EELKSIEGLQPASRSCKEVADFVTGNADPLIPTTKKIRRSRRFWKWLWGKRHLVSPRKLMQTFIQSLCSDKDEKFTAVLLKNV
ncbi:UNVERIFIED_CONTAM: hypothetical protein Sangu_1524900, partial [Sesamum angustifolium]